MSDERFPFYPWFPADFQKKTRHLSLIERAVYRELLDEMWITDQESASIPDDPDYIANVLHIAVDEWIVIRKKLVDGPRPVIQKRGHMLTNGRLREELENAKLLSELAAEKGKKSGRSRRLAAAQRRIAEQQLNSGSTVVEPNANRTRTETNNREEEVEEEIQVPSEPEKRKTTTNARTRKEGKQITEGQFLYLADSIRKWRESHPQIGPGEADFDARFSDSFGFTWDYWTQAQERFGMTTGAEA